MEAVTGKALHVAFYQISFSRNHFPGIFRDISKYFPTLWQCVSYSCILCFAHLQYTDCFHIYSSASPRSLIYKTCSLWNDFSHAYKLWQIYRLGMHKPSKPSAFTQRSWVEKLFQRKTLFLPFFHKLGVCHSWEISHWFPRFPRT